MRKAEIVCKVDSLGQIIIPKDVRRLCGKAGKATAFEICIEGQTLVLRPYPATCCICGAASVKQYRYKSICADCQQGLRK